MNKSCCFSTISYNLVLVFLTFRHYRFLFSTAKVRTLCAKSQRINKEIIKKPYFFHFFINKYYVVPTFDFIQQLCTYYTTINSLSLPYQDKATGCKLYCIRFQY